MKPQYRSSFPHYCRGEVFSSKRVFTNPSKQRTQIELSLGGTFDINNPNARSTMSFTGRRGAVSFVRQNRNNPFLNVRLY